jgi:hypothetical protein
MAKGLGQIKAFIIIRPEISTVGDPQILLDSPDFSKVELFGCK